MSALVQRQLDAYNRRNLEEFVACFHPEIRIIRFLKDTPDEVGIDSFRKGYAAFFESSPDLHCELRHRIVLDQLVIDEEWVTGRKNFPEGRHLAAMYGFRDGLIDQVWFLG